MLFRSKGKVGGLSLAEDVKRMEVVREVIGPERDLMIDVNRAWDLQTAIEGARLLEPLNPRWLEEPVRVGIWAAAGGAVLLLMLPRRASAARPPGSTPRHRGGSPARAGQPSAPDPHR